MDALHARVLDALAHLYAARGQAEAVAQELRGADWSTIYAAKIRERLDAALTALREIDDAIEKAQRLALRSRRF